MKKHFLIFLLAIALMSIQACKSKAEKETEKANEELAQAAKEDSVRAATAAEKEARIEKDLEALTTKRKTEFEKRAKVSLTYKDKDGNIVYNKAETDPSFEGGNRAMVKYLRQNLVFPKTALDKGLEGEVFVDFVVTKLGNVREVEVTEETSKTVDQSFRDEAIRVVASMPKWTPALQHGKKVDVRFSIPITFRMTE